MVCNTHLFMQKFKNQDVAKLVADVKSYGNLILNDAAIDSEGNVICKTENRTKDDKMNRQYYNATFISLENINVARTVTLWQAHTNEGKGCIWKSLNPKLAARMIGQDVSGKIAIVNLTETYMVGDNEVDTVTLFIPHEDELESEIERFLIQNELITEPEDVSVS